jgi:hypothetical protein
MASTAFNTLLKNRPQFASPVDQSSWTMPKALTSASGAKLTELAMQDPSAWEGKLNTAQGLDQQKMLQTAQEQAQAGTAGMQNRLAMRGGIGSGAMERANLQGSQNLMKANTDIGMGGAIQRATNALSAQEMQNSLLGSAAGNEQIGIANVLGQNTQLNAANLGTYNAQLQALAAKEQAAATQKAGQGGK